MPELHLQPEPPNHKPIKRCKNIVVCCDGTGNEFGECNSNVVRLYTALCVDNDQVAYYHPGVGTMGAATAKTHLGKTWSKIQGLAFGTGFRDNVLDAYRYIMETYDDGDHVFLFGFSRGAYTARALAGLLHGYGLLCRGNEGHIPYAWRAYKDQLKAIQRQNVGRSKAGKQTTVTSEDQFKDTFSHPNFTIHFVGLWDTVSSVGWVSEPLQLLHIAQNPSMCIGRHAISIDERRCFFQDNLWGEALPHQDVLQVWFGGVHSDVGGSYRNDESYLSNQALEWLLDEAESAGLQLQAERKKMVLGKEHHLTHAAASLYSPAPKPDCKEIPHHSLHGPWWLLEVFPHRFYDKDEGGQHWRIPLGAPRTIPRGSLVHPSAVQRMDDQQFAYAPPNLNRSLLKKIETHQPAESPGAVGLYRYETGPHIVPKIDSTTHLGRAAAAALLALIGAAVLVVQKSR